MFREIEPQETEDTSWLISALKGHKLGQLCDLEFLQETYNLDAETAALLVEQLKLRIQDLENIPEDVSVKDILEGSVALSAGNKAGQ